MWTIAHLSDDKMKTHNTRKLVKNGDATNETHFWKNTFHLCSVEGEKTQKTDWRKSWYVLGRGSDFLSVLVPLQLNCRVGQVNHQADLSTFINLICWFQFLCKSFQKTRPTPRSRFNFWPDIMTDIHLETIATMQLYQSIQNLVNTDLPSLFFSSFGIFFILFSRPLRSVMPYIKAIFSYWSGRAFFRISHTSTSGVSSCCFGSLVVPDTRERCEDRSHRLVFATCPEELLINL